MPPHFTSVTELKASSRVRLDFADVESVGATFLDSSLETLVARHGATVPRSIVFAHLQYKCRGEHRQGVKPSGTAPRTS